MSEADGQKFLKDLDQERWTATETNSKHKADHGAVACQDQTREVSFIDGGELACMMDQFLQANEEDTKGTPGPFLRGRTPPSYHPPSGRVEEEERR